MSTAGDDTEEEAVRDLRAKYNAQIDVIEDEYLSAKAKSRAIYVAAKESARIEFVSIKRSVLKTHRDEAGLR